jgi:hypothetical protein
LVLHPIVMRTQYVEKDVSFPKSTSVHLMANFRR